MQAIILAAGMGTRLRPLTLTTPKPLIHVQGEPMIERQIKFLHEKNIKDIIVVTGYLSEAFDYLDHPIVRLASEDVPVPYARVLEQAVLPDVEKIKAAIIKMANKGN